MKTNRDYLIISNNKSLPSSDQLCFVEGGFRDVLVKVRDLVHLGYRPVTHPLPASIRLFLSPVRSVVVEQRSHVDAVSWIEESIDKYDAILGQRQADLDHLTDYEFIDRQFIEAFIK